MQAIFDEPDTSEEIAEEEEPLKHLLVISDDGDENDITVEMGIKPRDRKPKK